MRKLYALYTNEMIKISRKIVVIIILAIMIIGVIAFGGLVKLQQSSIMRQTGDIDNSQWFKEEMKSQLEYYNKELAAVQQKLDAADTDEEKASFSQEKENIQSQVDLYQIAVDKGINLNTGGFKATLLNDLMSQKNQLRIIESIPSDQRTKAQQDQIVLLKQNIAQYTAILDSGDFAKYIEIKNKDIDQNTTISADEKTLKKDTNLLWLKLDPKGDSDINGDGYLLQSTLSQIENYRRSLLYNIDYTSQNQYVKPLTPDARQTVENSLAVLVYKAEHNMIALNNNSSSQMQEAAVTGMLGFGIFMLVCMMLILAGGSVSQEISSGSIKSLIISPTKRYKIFIAKLASLVTVGVFSAIVLYIFVMVSNGVYFGFSSGSPFIFAINGTAMQINFYIYRLAYLFIDFIDVLVYMMLAFMLSIVTRNTATSVGISIAVYFGGSIASSFIMLFAQGEWVKFIPFSNLSLAARIFPDSLNNIGMNLFGNQSITPSTTFSIIYLAVLMICMGYTALDSFKRRDIK